MFFKKNKDKEASKPAASEPPQKTGDPATESLLRVIAEKKKEDPMIGLKIGAKEIETRFLGAFKNDKGVHVESYVTALASLAGFSCQMALREEIIKTGKAAEKDMFMTLTDSAGNNYYAGENIIKLLAENKFSIWSIVGGGIQQAGGQLPDMHSIIANSVQTIGTENFTRPRVPERHQQRQDTPQNYIRNLWPVTLPILNMFCDRPAEWPIMLALALQSIIVQGKNAIDPQVAGIIALETAAAMSKIDPAAVIKN